MQEALGRYPDAGLAGCLILNPDGIGAGRLPTGNAHARQGVRACLRPGARSSAASAWPEAPPATSSAPAIRFRRSRSRWTRSPARSCSRGGSALEKVGPLDEGYFLHCEDLDWCERFRRAGFKVLFVPGATVVHDKGASSRSRPVRVLWHLHRGMVRFYRKFFRDEYPLAALLAGPGGRVAAVRAARRRRGREAGGRPCPRALKNGLGPGPSVGGLRACAPRHRDGSERARRTLPAAVAGRARLRGPGGQPPAGRARPVGPAGTARWMTLDLDGPSAAAALVGARSGPPTASCTRRRSGCCRRGFPRRPRRA